jgi:hypothetical protein
MLVTVLPVRFEVLTVGLLRMQVFWDVTLCWMSSLFFEGI